MKRLTLILSLMVAMVTTAMAQSSLLVNDALGTFTNGQYSWKSGKMTKAEGATKLRVTFLETSNNEKPAGFPCVAIAEFYLYDKGGNVVTLAEGNFSSNATQGNEGKMSSICDGFTTQQDGQGENDWYWHSQWSGTPNPYGYHYLEIDLTDVPEDTDLSEYSIGWVTRRSQASPKKIIVSTGATINEAAENANSLMLPKVSTDIVYLYTIKSVRSKNYLTYSAEHAKPVQNNAVSNESYWYFTEGADGKVVMCNAVSGKVLGTNFEMSTEGEWKLLPAKYRPGIVISNTGDYINSACIDDQNGSIGGWSHNSGDNEGTTWLVEEVKLPSFDVPMLSLQGMKISSIGDAVTEVKEGWYILNNVGRGNIVSQEGHNWKMRPTGNVAVDDFAKDKAGYLFKVTKNGENYNVVSGNGKYFQLGKNTASTSATPVNIDITVISGNNFCLFDKDHGYAADGQETGYAFVGWATTPPTSAGGNDSYKLLPVTLENVSYTVVYNFIYNEEVKFSQTVEKIKPGNEYPDMTIKLPYGVTSDFAVPEGTVTKDDTFDFDLTVEAELPFETAASAADIKTWYYARMHTNQPGYIGDIAEDNSINVAWGKSSDVANDNYVWGFVGDVFSGITVVNKGTGKQLTSTGGGNATLADNGTVFFVARTTETSANATNGFCLRRNDSNQYLNANYSAEKLSHWGSTDAGSTFFLSEYEEDVVTVSEAGWATMYLGYQAYIPEGVNVYAVTGAENGYVTKSQLEGVIPANTGVLLENAGEFTFKRAAKDVNALEGNLMKGSVENTYVEGTAYVLANDSELGVGMYKADLNKDAEGNEGTTHFLNNAGKAYLVLPAASETVAFYGLDWDGTTGISEVKTENGEVKAIYDLTGRKLKGENGNLKGIYIINGKKVLVK